MGLIRSKLWHYCTCDDESAALARLKRHERQAFEPEHGRPQPEAVARPRVVSVSDDERLAHAIQVVHERRGTPLMVLIQAAKKPWTLEEFEELLAKAENHRLTAMGVQ